MGSRCNLGREDGIGKREKEWEMEIMAKISGYLRGESDKGEQGC